MLSQTQGQVTYVLLTRSPLTINCIATINDPFDLHVLGTPPAFILSQNQTLLNNRNLLVSYIKLVKV